jgi:hypothetical protein
MSNETLKQRLLQALDRFEKKESSLRELAQAIELHTSALEEMPYSLINNMNRIARQMEVISYFDEEGYKSESAGLLREFRECLDKVPLAV